MPSFVVQTPQRAYPAVVERGAIASLAGHIPASAGLTFIITTEDVWQAHGHRVTQALDAKPHKVLFFPGGEGRKRLSEVECLAEHMVRAGADRSSIVVAFGGGIVNDLGGFLAASFMRGVPVIQVPTTLLAQVDAGIGGKTGVNLVSGKNLFGAFHQPLAVLIDPGVLTSLPEREFRAGLYEVLKTGVIRSAHLFELMVERYRDILRLDDDLLLDIISESVAIKAAVVSADERESNLRRILNFGHTLGHALEAETSYTRLLHGEAVAFGMRAATHLARLTGLLDSANSQRIVDAIDLYGPIPALNGVAAAQLVGRLGSDKKTVKGTVHFVLPVKIGEVKIVAGVDPSLVLSATGLALGELARR